MTNPSTEPQRARATVVRQCLTDLTDSEQQHYGARLANAKIERDDVAAAAKTTADEYKGRIGTKSAEIDRLARLVSDKKELRSVECYRELHPGNRLVIVRSDTGEIVSSTTADLEDLARFRDEAENERKRKAAAKDKEKAAEVKAEKPAEATDSVVPGDPAADAAPPTTAKPKRIRDRSRDKSRKR